MAAVQQQHGQQQCVKSTYRAVLAAAQPLGTQSKVPRSFVDPCCPLRGTRRDLPGGTTLSARQALALHRGADGSTFVSQSTATAGVDVTNRRQARGKYMVVLLFADDGLRGQRQVCQVFGA